MLSAREDEAAAFGAMDAEDWKRIERSPEFERLVAARRRVVVPSLSVFVLVYGGFIVLAAWGHRLMAREILGGLTVAYAFALGLIVMTWLLAVVYIRASNRRIDPLAAAVAELVAARAGGVAAVESAGIPPGGETAR
jgi:uncharacterized membrane protein (DUF485 family)